MTKITIHDAFAKKKLLEKTIPQKIEDLKVVYSKKETTNKINGTLVTELEKKVKSEYQSLTDSIKLYRELTRKIYQSNAVTKIFVGKNEYTILEALQIQKLVFPHQEHLLNDLIDQCNSTKRYIEMKNENLEELADKFITSLANGDKTDKQDFVEQRQMYIKQRQLDLFDPLNIENIIKSAQEELNDFITNLDSALSVSNATTYIEID